MRKRFASLLIYAAIASPLARCQLATHLNDNATTPAAPAGTRNIVPQNDGGFPTVNTTHYVIYPTIQVNCPASGDLSAPVAAAITVASSASGGIIDARACTSATTWTTAITISKPDIALLLPCAPLTASQVFTVAAGIRNTVIRGCSYQGTSASSGAAGGTVWIWNGTGPAFTIGDPTYATDTPGFAAQDLAINTSGAASGAGAFYFYRTQEISLANLYLLGDNSTDQTAITLDGTGNYTGGNFANLKIDGYGTAALLTGHLSGSVNDDYANASTFTKIHIDCPTSGGNPISGTYGWNVSGGDGNTWSGGDVESCSTMFHFGSAATANTVLGVRNENSTYQYVADAHSSYNSVKTGGTFYTGRITDSGQQNSFEDAFHRDWNQVNGDRYASQVDTTLTNNARLGTGQGNERGLLNQVQTDYGYRWIYGFTDGTTGTQFFDIEDLLNDVQRLSIGQYLSATADTVTNVVVNNGGCYTSSTPPTIAFTGGSGSSAAGTGVMSTSTCAGGWQLLSVTMTNHGSGYTSQPTVTATGSNQTTAPSLIGEITAAGSTNDQTALNSAGTGAVVLNGGANAGSGGTVFASGGASPVQVAAIDSSGNATIAGDLLFQNVAGLNWEFNCATSSLCEIHDASATTPANVFRAFPNASTEIDSQGTSPVTINSTSTGGTGGFIVYGGGTYSATEIFGVTQSGGNGVYKFPSLAAASGTHYCAQFDGSGYLSNTGNPCPTGTGTGTVTSVGLSAPTDLTVTNSPITAAGTIALTWTNGTGPAIAAAASAAASSPAQCPSGQYAQGVTTAWAANCSQINYSQLTGTVPHPSANTLGCLDGWDHLPCTVYIQSPLSESSPTATYATVFTTSATGLYRVSGYIYGTTASSTSYSVEQFVKVTQTGQAGGNGYLQSEAQIGTTISSDPWYTYTFPLSSGATVQTESITANGTNTSGVWTRGAVIERLQ